MKLGIAIFSYAGLEPSMAGSLLDELMLLGKISWRIWLQHGDALISRARSVVASEFLRDDLDVLVMVDRDIQWSGGQHDLRELATQALIKKACVAGFYCTRAKGVGYSGRLKEERARVKIGEDKLHEAEYLPGGFLAIPRSALECVLKAGRVAATNPTPPLDIANEQLHECSHWDGSPFWCFFRPIEVESTLVAGKFEALSEDWSFSWRCRRAGVPLYLWSKPRLIHHGSHGFVMEESVQPVAPTTKVR